MTHSKRFFIDQQLERIARIKADIEHISSFSMEDLSNKSTPTKWSAIECFAHLNLTYDHYLPRIESAFTKSKPDQRAHYKGGVLMPKMIKSLLPDENGALAKTMKTFKKTTPTTNSGHDEISRYVARLESVKIILSKSEFQNIRSPRVTSLVGPIMRFRLGDAIAFMLAHDTRHISQAMKAVKNK